MFVDEILARASGRPDGGSGSASRVAATGLKEAAGIADTPRVRQTTTPTESLPKAATRRPLWAGGSGATHPLATLSVILGVLWLGGAGSVLAVVCGHRARRQIAERWRPGAGRAALGIRLGWIGIVVATVLALLVIFTPEALDQQLDNLKRGLRGLLDDRTAFG